MGYALVITDLVGKVQLIKDFYCSNFILEDYLGDSYLEGWFEDFILENNSELLVIFEYKTDYNSNIKEWINIKHIEVLREDYKNYYKDLIYELDKFMNDKTREGEYIYYFPDTCTVFKDLNEMRKELYRMCDEYLMIYSEGIKLIEDEAICND